MSYMHIEGNRRVFIKDNYHCDKMRDAQRIFSVKMRDSRVEFREECDQCFCIDMPPSDAVAMLREMADHIADHYKLDCEPAEKTIKG